MVNKTDTEVTDYGCFCWGFPSLALVYPVTRSEIATIITVARIRYSLGKIIIESIGRLPSTKAMKLVDVGGSMPWIGEFFILDTIFFLD